MWTDVGAFVRLGPAHLTAMAAIACVALALAWRVRKGLSLATSRRLRLGLAAGLVAAQIAEQISAHAEGRLLVALPLQLCDLNWLLAIVGLLSLERRVAEPLYFFALAGTLPGILTPELPVGFPSARFLAYFSTHGLVVISAVVLTFGFGLLPARGAPWRAFALLNVYALLVTPVNLALRTNFLYLRAKPAPGTPFDWLGPWPYYILGLEAGFLGVFFLLDRALWSLRGDAPPE
jgi:hypothetical integral membrane protein (TIGR02206 family)